MNTQGGGGRPNNGQLAAAIRRRRDEIGLTQDGLARAAGVSPRTIQRYEHGDHAPSAEARLALARALNVSPDLLLAGGDAK